MDALSHILEDIHLTRAEYLYVSGRGKWGFRLKGHASFHIVMAGPIRLTLNDEECELQTGDIAFVPAGATHQLSHPDYKQADAPWLMTEFQGHKNDPVIVGEGLNQEMTLSLRCLLDTEMGKPLLSSLPDYMLIRQGLDGSGPEWLQLGLNFLALETRIFRPGRDTLLDRLVSMFLIECIRDYIEQLPETADNWLVAVGDPYLAPALSAIHSAPDEGWTVSELAKVACLSRSAFHERFSDVIGMPPLTYLTNHRLRLAGHLLVQGDLSVGRISQRVGYKSEAAFSQAFRRHYQVTPSQYRKEHQPISA